MLITDAYRDLNAALHDRDPEYGTSGHKWAKAVNDLARQAKAGTVLDYGCGRGTLKLTLQETVDAPPYDVPNYDVLEYDPALPEKMQKPLRADVVVCGDVLEHIEPECLYAVLDDIKSIARTAVFLVVATRPARKTLPDGRNTHLIVESSAWWVPKLINRWKMMAFQDLGGEFVFIGKAF